MLKLKKIQIKKSKWQENHQLDEGEDFSLAYPPSFSANEKQIPEIADWKVGETYQIVIEVEMKRMSSYDNGTKKSTDASFDVVGYKVVDDISDDDLEEMQGEALGN